MSFRISHLSIALASMLALTSHAGEAVLSSVDPVEEGRRIYQQYCATCHGSEAEGAPDWQKPDERGELPAPPHGPDGHTWRHSDAMLRDMITHGWRDPFNATQRLTMPPFESLLSPREIDAVISYLKTLWTPEQRQFQERESRVRPGQSGVRQEEP